ncbi:MAG TPA: tetratricopeptide repeat protein [Anaeromyxobacter sp.]
MATHLAIPLALLTSLAAAPAAEARAEPGTRIENVELRTLAGGKERLLSTQVKANVFVFFRSNQERSLDALKQMAACEKELAGKSIHWAAVVSGSDPAAEVSAAVVQSGIKMSVLVDEGDVLYDRLAIRLHPMVGIADAKLTLLALEPYRQIDYCDVVKARIRFALGELDQASLDKLLNPARSPLPGDDPMKKAMRDVHMARRLLEIGNYPESVKFAQRALLVAPVSQAFTVMGKAYAKQGQCAEAARAFEQALKLDPKDADAAAGKGSCR